MRFSNIGKLVACAAVALTMSHGAADAQNKTFTMPMHEDAAVIVWSFEPSGEMIIAAMIAPVQGRVAVCGFYAITARLSAEARRDQLPRHARGKSSLYIGNKKLTDGLRHMNEVSAEDFNIGTRAKCILTQHAWQKGYSNKKLEIRAPSFRAF